jgi:hypothetical protein
MDKQKGRRTNRKRQQRVTNREEQRTNTEEQTERIKQIGINRGEIHKCERSKQ